MLTPDKIAALRDAAGQIADPITEYLIADIARRISQAAQLTSTAAYEVWRAQNMGVSQREIRTRLQKLLGKSSEEIDALLTQAAEVGYNFDLKRLPTAAAIPFEKNAVLQQIVSASVKLAQEDFTNITQTLGMVDPYGNALPLQDVYRSATDFAFKQVSTGATDYNTAIRQATRNIAKYGLRTIDYESGVHTSMEAAVRRNIMGGLGLMQEQISQQNHDDMGADGWEISAHAASAPDHEPIQGKQYSDAEYTALNDSLQRRIGTLNCGHAVFPIILGVSQPQYTPEELRKFREDNADGITYQGKHYTGYEATQMQRKLERSIRTQKRSVLVAEGNPEDKDRLLTAQTRLTRLNQEYRRFSKAAGLRPQQERAEVVGFGRKQAAQARSVDAGTLRLRELDGVRQARLLENPSLALPNAKTAVLEPEKFAQYLFNENNPRGFAKGVAFTKRLGYDIKNWEELSQEIKSRSALYPASKKGDAGHGMKYEQRMILYGKRGSPANVVVSWIDENGTPRMTSAYIKEVKEHDN